MTVHRGFLLWRCDQWIPGKCPEGGQGHDYRDPAWSGSLAVRHRKPALHCHRDSPGRPDDHLCGYSRQDCTLEKFDLNANASSGLPVSFTSLHPGVATVESNGTVTIVGAGVATMRATQDGNGSYNPAPSVEKTLTVTKVPQTITFNAP